MKKKIVRIKDADGSEFDLNQYYRATRARKSEIVHARWYPLVGKDKKRFENTVCGRPVHADWFERDGINLVTCERCRKKLMVDFIMRALADVIAADKVLENVKI